MSSESKIRCESIWKLFGPSPENTLAKIDHTHSRAQIQQDTDHVVAVRDVSFSVEEGETFVVMGLSGSGKSTLVRCLSRLIDPTDGQVFIDNQDITRVSHSELKHLRRHRMSMVFQHFGLFPHRTVRDNVAYGLEVRGEGRQARYEKANEFIDLVGLGGWADHYPRELSGGMQQRVGLARAMAVEPEILLFDEPFSALDPLIRREMQDELLALQSKLKKTMVFITHDFLEAIKMGDHIMIMRDGAISQIGTSEEIVANPADSYVADFTEDVPRYKVLSAGKVMRPVEELNSDQPYSGGLPTVSIDAKLDTLIEVLTESEDCLPVVDQQGVMVGEIDRKIVMQSMSTSI